MRMEGKPDKVTVQNVSCSFRCSSLDVGEWYDESYDSSIGEVVTNSWMFEYYGIKQCPSKAWQDWGCTRIKFYNCAHFDLPGPFTTGGNTKVRCPNVYNV